ncbi:MAG: lectin-like protein [Candidatus Poribacteria bacterium]|nr:lectin-like protein [Candidatus Poribacteria bacterium]
MKRPYTTHFLVFVGSVVLLLATALPSVAASFSGRVVDEAGQPVEGLIIALPSFPGNTPPHQHQRFQGMFPPVQPSETDATGAFSIKNIVTPSVSRLRLFPERNSDYEIRSVEIEGIAFYLDQHQQHFGGFNFAIAPETDIKNVEITVRLRMRIRGRVLSADGTPLHNAQVNLMVKHRDIDGRGSGSSGGTRTLDADGYFVDYVDDGAAYYTVTVTYQGQTVESEEILLEEGQRMDGLVLKLGGEPEQAKPERVVVAPPPRVHDPARFEAARKREREGMWAINPDNRHAYKMIRCDSREAAQERAAAQGAHLLTINDKAEQEWLLEVFGKRENFWIGLTAGSKAGKQQWDNGEPITYTNWISPQAATEITKSTQGNDANPNYVVLVGMTGKWQVARPGSPLIRMTERAILEKENFIIGAPVPEGEVEKR